MPESLRVDPEAVAAAPGLLEPEVREAMRVAARNIEAVARAELEARARPATAELPEGQRVEVREEPVATAGVYAPGGRAAYPSSVLMCCVPPAWPGWRASAWRARPVPPGGPTPRCSAACAIAGVDEVYAIGGAQAIAALAFGTETIDPVDLIAGPGNRYVHRGQATGLGAGRDRRDRRAQRADGGRRRHGEPGVDRARPLRPGRSTATTAR